jgi:hypothetical protein
MAIGSPEELGLGKSVTSGARRMGQVRHETLLDEPLR